jgi:hypothetical protein
MRMQVRPLHSFCVARSHLVREWRGGIQRIYDGGWDPSGESDNSKSEQVKQCMDLEHCLHCLHLEATHLLLPFRAMVRVCSSHQSPHLQYYTQKGEKVRGERGGRRR